VATAVAEFFRDQGLDVMLLLDSVTRFARAQREIGLAAGEPPATRGYPPSMFDSMPKLLERSGTSDKGSITGFYTILVDGDDMDEPVADTVRGILDGHVVLSRRLAQAYHYPAIDVLQSVSRLAPVVSGVATAMVAGLIRRTMAVFAEAEDLINVGAYQHGSNQAIDEAIGKHGQIEEFLIQDMEERSALEDTLEAMSEITGVETPVQEMVSSIPKLFDHSSKNVNSGSSAFKQKRKTEEKKIAHSEDATMALNSVATLFSSMPPWAGASAS
jgi:flagellum-specific ATP synthase